MPEILPVWTSAWDLARKKRPPWLAAGQDPNSGIFYLFSHRTIIITGGVYVIGSLHAKGGRIFLILIPQYVSAFLQRECSNNIITQNSKIYQREYLTDGYSPVVACLHFQVRLEKNDKNLTRRAQPRGEARKKKWAKRIGRVSPCIYPKLSSVVPSPPSPRLKSVLSTISYNVLSKDRPSGRHHPTLGTNDPVSKSTFKTTSRSWYYWFSSLVAFSPQVCEIAWPNNTSVVL
jgi:hypothetical protein